MRSLIRGFAYQVRTAYYRRQLGYYGTGSTISSQAKIVGHHGISIGDNSHILDFAVIHSGPWSSRRLPASRQYKDRIIIGNHTSIQPYAFLSSSGGYIKIGDHCTINPFCVLYGFGGLEIGNNVRIATGCVLVAQNHRIFPGTGPITEVPEGESGVEGKGIIIRDNVWLGAHVIVLDGVEIGEGAVIGAGAIVPKNIPPGVVAVGNPAKVIRER